jgi:hypothetical protein
MYFSDLIPILSSQEILRRTFFCGNLDPPKNTVFRLKKNFYQRLVAGTTTKLNAFKKTKVVP